MARHTDVVTLGETMLRLATEGARRIEQSSRLELEIGGSESNVAVGLARLGLRTTWLSRLPDNALGRLVVRTLAKQGVDTSHVIFAPGSRLGLYFLEEATAPRASRVIYDRKHSAFSEMTPEALPETLFQTDSASLLHVSGITAALSDTAASTARRAVALAKDAGWLVSFDLNFRRALWSAQAARRACEPLMQAADILIAPRRDTVAVLGFTPKEGSEAIAQKVAERYGNAIVVLTLGAEGAVGYERSAGRIVSQEAVATSTRTGRVGGGDAFCAGFLYGYLMTEEAPQRLPEGLRWGAAMASLKYTIVGDMPLVEKEEVALLVAQLRGNSPRGTAIENWR